MTAFHHAADAPARPPELVTYGDEFLALCARRKATQRELDALDSRLSAMAAVIEQCPLLALRLPSGGTAVLRRGRPALAVFAGGADAAR